jgi:group I intron endonuclease
MFEYKMSEEKKGTIYKLRCKETGKCYVGQTRNTKMREGKPYSYGVTGRWNDHVSCPATTPLGSDILKYGRDGFVVEKLEENIPEDLLDEREAFWIAESDSMVPNGYNVMRHGRCRHRNATSLAKFYIPTTTSVRLRQIRRAGVPHIIYAYLEQSTGEEVRITFGQAKDSNYANAVREATEFLLQMANIPIEADPRVLSPDATEYDEKLARFDGVSIKRIRVAKCNTLAAVYVDSIRICFGGKTTTYPQAVKKALQFAHSLHIKHPEATVVDDASKSATGGCLPSWGENSEGKTVESPPHGM